MEIEKKITEMSEDDLDVDGNYLTAVEVVELKGQLRMQGEQIWSEIKKKLLSIITRP